jgi:DNA-binding CsgD family transcriptional regulator
MESLRDQLLILQQELNGNSHQQLEAKLRERIKELDCLYKLTSLIEQHENSLDKILQGAVELLQISWQYPEIACARIIYREQVFKTSNFKGTQWRQKSPIVISGRQEGLVEVHYLKKKPQEDEGPFLKEERLLIDAVGNRIAKLAERINTQRQLQVERQALLDANVALHDSLVQSQREKKMLGVSIQAKIDKIISPIFYALQEESVPGQKTYMELLKNTLDDIVSPFVEGDRRSMSILSPVELQITNMVKHGLSTKKIAEIRGISPATVNRHRESIRRKLGITNSKVNLVSYLNRSTV